MFTAGTGFDRSGRTAAGTYLLVTPTTNWTAATCTDASKCTIGQRVIPDMTQSSLTIPLVPAQTEYAPRLTQVDFSFAKNFTVRGRPHQPEAGHLQRVQLGRLHGGVARCSSAAATYVRPSVILQGRIIRFGADIKW